LEYAERAVSTITSLPSLTSLKHCGQATAGMNGFIRKPYSKAELADVVENFTPRVAMIQD
jgi:hypothetical protein